MNIPRLFLLRSASAFLCIPAARAVTPAELAAALDTTGLTWSSGGEVTTTTAPGSTADGVDAVQLDEAGWIEAEITGPAVLLYKQKSGRSISVSVENSEVKRHLSSGAFQTECLALPAGPHRVRWQVTYGPALLDDFKLIAPQPPSAVNTPGAAWDTVEGPAWWAVPLAQPLIPGGAGNGWLLLPPPLEAGTLRVTLTGTGVLEASSLLTASVDGVAAGMGSPHLAVHHDGGTGAVTWPARTAAATHSADAVMASFTPQSPLPFHTASNTSGGQWVATGNERWTAAGSEIRLPQNAAGSLQRRFTGAAEVIMQATLPNGTLVSLDGYGCPFPQGTVSFPIPTGHGAHSVEFRAPAGPLSLTDWSETPDMGPPLDGTLESTGWRTGGSAPWRGVPAHSLDFCVGGGVQDYALSGTPPPGGDSWIERDVTGPGELRFTARGAGLRLHIGDTTLWTGTGAQQSTGVIIPAGQHTVRFTATALARVISAAYIPGVAGDIAAALDNPGPLLAAASLGGWQVHSGTAHTGTTALRSGSPGSTFAMHLSGPVLASFQIRNLSGTSSASLSMQPSTGAPLYASTLSNNAWREVMIFSPSAAESWTFTTPGANLLMDTLRLSTPQVSLAEGLDFPALQPVPTAGTWAGFTGIAGAEGGDCIAGAADASGAVSLSAAFTGPGTLTWRYLHPPSFISGVTFFDNDVQRPLATGSAGWLAESIFLTAGAHTVRWEVKSDSGFAGVPLLDAVKWTPAPTVPLAEAMETPAFLTLTTSGTSPWFGFQRNDAFDGTDLAIGGAAPAGDISWLDTTAVGAPAHFDFRARLTGTTTPLGTGNDYFIFSAGGAELSRLSAPGSTGWLPLRAWLPAGQTLRHSWKPGGPFHPSDEAALDAFAPVISPSVAEALNAAARPWLFNTHSTAWTVAPAGAEYGTACAVCSLLSTTSDAWASTPVRGPALVRFRWNQGNSTGDRIIVRVDEQFARSIPNVTGWTNGDVPVPAGDHAVTWVAYRTAGDGANTVSLDRIEVIPTGYGAWATDRAFPLFRSSAVDDPDADGVSNLMEFATGTDPLVPNSPPMLTPSLIGGTAVSYMPLPSYDLSGLTWRLETSTDLRLWANAGTFSIASTPGGPVLTASLPASNFPLYARLRVLLP